MKLLAVLLKLLSALVLSLTQATNAPYLPLLVRS